MSYSAGVLIALRSALARRTGGEHGDKFIGAGQNSTELTRTAASVGLLYPPLDPATVAALLDAHPPRTHLQGKIHTVGAEFGPTLGLLQGFSVRVLGQVSQFGPTPRFVFVRRSLQRGRHAPGGGPSAGSRDRLRSMPAAGGA
jgi:hypothetical protein